jgi:hypothetical protein
MAALGRAMESELVRDRFDVLQLSYREILG